VVWQIAELFDEPQKTVLERAELAMQCVAIVRQKVGHIARPRGGRQANDRGLGSAERILGVSRRDLGRFEKIAGISPEAKEEARRAGLDDNQNALLEIAQVPAGKQIAKVQELKQEYSGGRRKPSAPTNSKKLAGSSAAAATKTKGVRTKQGPDEAESDAEPRDDVEDDADVSKSGAESPSIVPPHDGLDIPAEFRRTDEERIKAWLQKVYDNYLAPGWPDTPIVLQLWFVTEVLRVAIVNTGKKETPR
jgi:ParB family chromosome partitioning protein